MPGATWKASVSSTAQLLPRPSQTPHSSTAPLWGTKGRHAPRGTSARAADPGCTHFSSRHARSPSEESAPCPCPPPAVPRITAPSGGPHLAAHAIGVRQRGAAGARDVDQPAGAVAHAAGIQGSRGAAGAGSIQDGACRAACASSVHHPRGTALQLRVDDAGGAARWHLRGGRQRKFHAGPSKGSAAELQCMPQASTHCTLYAQAARSTQRLRCTCLRLSTPTWQCAPVKPMPGSQAQEPSLHSPRP